MRQPKYSHSHLGDMLGELLSINALQSVFGRSRGRCKFQRLPNRQVRKVTVNLLIV